MAALTQILRTYYYRQFNTRVDKTDVAALGSGGQPASGPGGVGSPIGLLLAITQAA